MSEIRTVSKYIDDQNELSNDKEIEKSPVKKKDKKKKKKKKNNLEKLDAANLKENQNDTIETQIENKDETTNEDEEGKKVGIDPQGRSTVTAGIDHYFHSVCTSVRAYELTYVT